MSNNDPEVDQHRVSFMESVIRTIHNDKMRRYFSHQYSVLTEASNHKMDKHICQYCHQSNPLSLETRLISRKRACKATQASSNLKRNSNVLSISCKTCKKTAFLPAFDRTAAPTLSLNSVVAPTPVLMTPKNKTSQSSNTTPLNKRHAVVDSTPGNSAKKRRKPVSKLQQQLMNAKLKQKATTPSASLSDFLSL